MALNAYLQQVQRLLHNPTGSLYNTADLTSYINTARGQIAGEDECIRAVGQIVTAGGTQVYQFSSITGLGASISGVLNVRMASVVVGSGASLLAPRPFEWLNTYYISNPSPPTGTPNLWAQYGQGAAGSIYLAPIPTTISTINLDTVCLPIVLVDDTTAEAIPYPWTDAVPYFAAYLAYLEAQRQQDALNMLSIYEMFVRRARQMSTPTVLPQQYPGSSGAAMAAMNQPVTLIPGAPAPVGGGGGGGG